ncbi:MAG TPA: TIGR02677 family protein [Dermatophilaceae bacterium]|nr:TIGR02677 family protein [Dermatophilaceae bacterium]
MTDEPRLSPEERHALGAMRAYAATDEAGSYLAIMRLFTTGMTGLMSDLSAAEITERLVAAGIDLDADTVDARLSYLVDHGNLARSPRETEARSVREYLTNRARYQLTQRGELVHRQVEELLGHTDSAREVSSEMLGGILRGLDALAKLPTAGLEQVDPSDIAERMTTVFAQFELLVTSTRQFYAYLSQVLSRYDLGREEFQVFKGVLLDYLQRFVDDVSRHMPQIADRLTELTQSLPALVARAGAGQRLVGLDGREARRAPGLAVEDWASVHAWFVGAPGRASDADNVRALATDAMRALLANLRRIAGRADRQQSRWTDLLDLARWFDEADDATAHAAWAAAYGLYSARHLDVAAEDDSDPVPPTTSWWSAPPAEVPLAMRSYGSRRHAGRTGAREDFSAAKAARLAERQAAQERRVAAMREIAGRPGEWGVVDLSDDARGAVLDLYSRAVTGRGRPIPEGESAVVETPLGAHEDSSLRLSVCRRPGTDTVLRSPRGQLRLTGLALRVEVVAAVVRREASA